MSQGSDLSIVLPPQLASVVQQAVATGEYSSSAAVVEEALHDWTMKRETQQKSIEELRRLWEEARTDETPGVHAHEVMNRLKSKYGAIADAAAVNG